MPAPCAIFAQNARKPPPATDLLETPCRGEGKDSGKLREVDPEIASSRDRRSWFGMKEALADLLGAHRFIVTRDALRQRADIVCARTRTGSVSSRDRALRVPGSRR
jgi:hypothetical protein